MFDTLWENKRRSNCHSCCK